MSTDVVVKIEVLGPVGVVRDDVGPLTLSPQMRRLLALLVVADGAVVSADRLAEYAADGSLDPSTVRTAISRLRRATGARIDHQSDGYRIDLTNVPVDAHDFDRLCSEAVDEVEPAARASLFAKALELWKGEALGELGSEDWALPFVARLTSARLTALEDLAEAQLDSGRASAAVETLEPHLLLHPYRERPVALMMRALAADGRTVEALRTYRTFRLRLRTDSGLEAGTELRDLEASLLGAGGEDRSITESAADGWTASVSGRARLDNLPERVVPVLRREREVVELRSLLTDRRLVTVYGTAGVGKTSIAIEAARTMRQEFDGGRRLVELASLPSAEDVAEPVRAALVDVVDGDALEAQRREQLVILDNCEHVLGSVRKVVRKLLEESPIRTVLCTSRQPLSIPGEVPYRLEPLSTETPVTSERRLSDAATVLADLARDATGTHPSDERTELVELIARRLGGLPLSLHLAASCLRTMTLDELARELQHQLDVLRRATGGEDRHVSLRTAVDWSVGLLSSDEQRIFGRLGVFAAPFDKEDVDAVLGGGDGTVVLVRALAERSLLQIRTESRGTVFEYLEPIRQLAAERLRQSGDDDDVHDRHASHYLQRAVTELASPGQRPSDLLERILPELQAAVDWLRSTNDRRLPAAIQSLARTAERVGRSELERGATEHALRLAEYGLNDNPGDTELLELAASAAWRLDELEIASTHARNWTHLASEADDPASEAAAVRLLARVQHEMHDRGGSTASIARLERLIDRLDQAEQARSWVTIAQLHQLRFEEDPAIVAADRAIEIAVELELVDVMLEAFVEKGSAMLDTDRQSEGIDLLYETSTLAEERGHALLVARAMFNVANYIEDTHERRRVLEVSRRFGQRAGLAGAGNITSKLVDVAVDEGDLEAARSLLRTALETSSRRKEPETQLSAIYLALEAGDTDEARQRLRHLDDRAIDLDPSERTLRDALSLRLAARDRDRRSVNAQLTRLAGQRHHVTDLWALTSSLDDLHHADVEHIQLAPLLDDVAEGATDEVELLRAWVHEVVDPAAARESYERALSVDPSSEIIYRIDPIFKADAYVGLARLDAEESASSAAVERLDRAIELLENWPGPRLKRVRAIRAELLAS